MDLINIKDLEFSYEKHLVLNHINLSISSNETVGLVGANGAGKSTLLNLILGLLPPDQGSISICEQPLNKKTLAQARAKMGFVFQDSDNQLFMNSAYEDVAFGPKNYGFSKEDVNRLTMNALEQVGAVYLKEKAAYQMSGGEKKLIAIATILSMNPELILMDEPTVSLDPRNRRQLIHLLNQLPQAKLIASHDLDMIMDTCERTILIGKGKIVADGPTQQILTNPKLMEENGLELPLRFQGQYNPISSSTH